MSITAREIGRSLEITLGGATDEMDDREREIAEQDVRRIIVPPVNAALGLEIWQFYARILFATTDESAEDTAVRMSRISVGAFYADDATAEEKATAEQRWAVINDLRHEEAERVLQMALYWNAQGGGLDVVKALLEDGHPKAQELLLARNELWNVYSRLKMLSQSLSSDEANEILARVGSSDTSTPSGTSPDVERDAFGIRQTA